MLEKIKKLICKFFGHKYIYDSKSLLPLQMICKRCGYDSTIPIIKEHIEKQLKSDKINNLKEIKDEIESGKIGGR